MKKLITTVLLLIIFQSAKSQGIFNQKGAQLKTLAQQVALIQTYIGFLKQGYNIADRGLNAISDFKNGEFNLHGAFFNSLKVINPKIKKYGRVAEIILMQTEILKIYRKSFQHIRQSNYYAAQEIEYVNRVYGRLLDDCDQIIDELIVLVTDGQLEMKDNERIARLDELYEQMLNASVFSKSFSAEAIGLGMSRLHDQQEINQFRDLYNSK